MFTLCLVLIAIWLTCAIIRRDIKKNADIIAENQQKLSRQISSIKTKNIDISDYERIIINNIIATLVKLEEAKCISYKTEIYFLNKIKEL